MFALELCTATHNTWNTEICRATNSEDHAKEGLPGPHRSRLGKPMVSCEHKNYYKTCVGVCSVHSCSTEARMARQLLFTCHDYKKQLWGCFSVVLKIPPVLHTIGLICGLLTHRIKLQDTYTCYNISDMLTSVTGVSSPAREAQAVVRSSTSSTNAPRITHS